jgi:hypothetical protein
MLCNNYKFQNEIQLDLLDLYKQIEQLIKQDNILQNKNFLQIENLLYTYSQNSKTKQILYKYIINFAIEAELRSSGSFIEIFNFLHKFMFDKQIIDDLKEKITTVNDKKNNIQDFNWLLSYFNIDLKNKDLLCEAITLAGFNGKILVEKGHDKFKTIIEKINGYVFDLPTKDVVKYFGQYENPKLVMIDGYIENVSEIHSLLEQSYEAKEYLIIFHRGMSDDVLNTLSVNWNRGTLRVIPIQVPYDLEGINTLNDIAVISNTDIISSLKGQLISTIRYETLTNIDRIEIANNKVTLINKFSDKRVKNHTQELLKKRSQVNDELTTLYDKRIRTLTSNLVIIKLCDDIFYLSNRQKIDKFLRAYRNFVSKGIIEFKDQKLLVSTAQEIIDFVPKIYERLNELGCVLCVE